ncbi:type II secretion system protein GspG [Stigmatella sp. ncwal1]|uniref:Type II secretion system protein GspG n=1 Tax=Stigmatella ashevillensis TaxID=2995309 RepID=A0ABT5DMG1_9BACT|nr:type II secretion system protein GspG [Stigmatella ashevillena]MDC0714847.1 type II secretion system protein GspG [Stigmatella ashevillena]
MAEHLSLQPPDRTASPARLGRRVLAIVFALATAMAFGLVYLTQDDALGQKQRRARAQIRRLEGYFQAFQRATGRFPTEQEGFTPLVQAKVMDSPPLDPWGHPYVYRMNEARAGIISYGSDGVPGGQGDAADITSGGLEETRP